jgi:hypothetical protein
MAKFGNAVLLHPMVVGHFEGSFDPGFTKPPPQDATEPFKLQYIIIKLQKICYTA